jgi:hypothetical protein
MIADPRYEDQRRHSVYTSGQKRGVAAVIRRELSLSQ